MCVLISVAIAIGCFGLVFILSYLIAKDREKVRKKNYSSSKNR